jgi:MoaA/NifB/PqqE/SkfB family radical SAM enzyme
MSNVLLTNTCNRRCSFCFAGSRVNIRKSKSNGDLYMAREKVRWIMRFMAASGEMQLRLLGGEPTLHPEFMEIVEEALEKGFHVHVFTNGIMKKEIADFLGNLPPEKFSLLCNISPQVKDSESKVKKRNYALRKLGEKAQVGMTLTEPEFDLSTLIDTIKAYGLRKRIRIGIAQPIVGRDNAYLHPSDYRRTGKAIVDAARQCIEKEILLGFDCGLTLCMFDDAEIGFLMRNTEGFVIRCSPILDIGSNLDVWHCFPLSEVLNSSMTRFSHRNEIVAFYNRIMNPYRALGCKPECLRCAHLHRGQCSGGCLAHAMKTLNRVPDRQAHAAMDEHGSN